MPFSFNPDEPTLILAALDCTSVVADAIALQQIAAPTFAEAPHAAEMYKRFNALGLANVSIDALGNVLARLPGKSAAPVLVTAHSTQSVMTPQTYLAPRWMADNWPRQWR